MGKIQEQNGADALDKLIDGCLQNNKFIHIDLNGGDVTFHSHTDKQFAIFAMMMMIKDFDFSNEEILMAYMGAMAMKNKEET